MPASRLFPFPELLSRLEALALVCRLRAMMAGRLPTPAWRESWP